MRMALFIRLTGYLEEAMRLPIAMNNRPDNGTTWVLTVVGAIKGCGINGAIINYGVSK